MMLVPECELVCVLSVTKVDNFVVSLRISLTQNEFRIIRDSKASKISIGSEPSVFGLRRKNRRTKKKNQRFFAKQRWIHSLFFSLLLASDRNSSLSVLA